MTQRDLDDAVARLRAAASRADPVASDPTPNLGPPRSRPETAGQVSLDPDIIDARARPETGYEPGPVAGYGASYGDPREPLPPVAFVGGDHAWHTPASRPPAPAPRIDALDRRAFQRTPPAPRDERGLEDDAQQEASGWGAARLPAFLRRGRPAPGPVEAPVSSPDDEPDHSAAPVSDFHEDEAAPARRGRSRQPRTQAAAPLTAREQRWQRRRRRYWMEEILGWLLVPVILIGLYWALVAGLAVLNLDIDDVVAGAQQAWDALRAR